MKKWIAPIIFSLAGILVSLFVYARLPESMAIHFGPSGDPDNFASRPIGAFALPVLIWIVSLIIVASAKFQRDESKRKRAESLQPAVLVIVSALLLGVHLFTISYNLGYEISPVKFASVAVGIVFILIGNLVPRMAQAGTLRKWPIKLSEQAERAHGRFQGRLMFITGFIFILLALLPDSIHSTAFFGLIILYIAVTFLSAFLMKGKAG